MAGCRGRKFGTVLIDKYDIVGKRFGKLYVVKYQSSRYDNTKGGEKLRHFYLCKCDCGKMIVVHRHSLIDDNTKSCGCLRRKAKKARRHNYGN